MVQLEVGERLAAGPGHQGLRHPVGAARVVGRRHRGRQGAADRVRAPAPGRVGLVEHPPPPAAGRRRASARRCSRWSRPASASAARCCAGRWPASPPPTTSSPRASAPRPAAEELDPGGLDPPRRAPRAILSTARLEDRRRSSRARRRPSSAPSSSSCRPRRRVAGRSSRAVAVVGRRRHRPGSSSPLVRVPARGRRRRARAGWLASRLAGRPACPGRPGWRRRASRPGGRATLAWIASGSAGLVGRGARRRPSVGRRPPSSSRRRRSSLVVRCGHLHADERRRRRRRRAAPAPGARWPPSRRRRRHADDRGRQPGEPPADATRGPGRRRPGRRRAPCRSGVAHRSAPAPSAVRRRERRRSRRRAARGRAGPSGVRPARSSSTSWIAERRRSRAIHRGVIDRRGVRDTATEPRGGRSLRPPPPASRARRRLARARCWSAFTAPTDLPSVVATCSRGRSATMRRRSTARWSSESSVEQRPQPGVGQRVERVELRVARRGSSSRSSIGTSVRSARGPPASRRPCGGGRW